MISLDLSKDPVAFFLLINTRIQFGNIHHQSPNTAQHTAQVLSLMTMYIDSQITTQFPLTQTTLLIQQAHGNNIFPHNNITAHRVAAMTIIRAHLAPAQTVSLVFLSHMKTIQKLI